jgi:hypothetical protein
MIISQDRGVEWRRIDPNKDEEGAGGGRNEPPGDQTWIRNEQVIRAFFISKSTVAYKQADWPTGRLLNTPVNKHIYKRGKEKIKIK